jgi:hypothetical protein
MGKEEEREWGVGREEGERGTGNRERGKKDDG